MRDSRIDLEGGLPDQSTYDNVIIRDLKSNVSVYVPAHLFNFLWRLINLVDPATDSTKFAVGLTQTTLVIAIPITISTTLLHAVIKGMQDDEVQELIHQGEIKNAAIHVLAKHINPAANPDVMFKALYDFATCVGWTAGYIAFNEIAAQLGKSFVTKLFLGATGAALGNVTGALTVGILWGAGSMVYDYCYREEPRPDQPSIPARMYSYLKDTATTIVPSFVWSMVGDASLFKYMMNVPGLAYFTDSTVLATAVGATSWLQNIISAGFCPKNAVTALVNERTRLLEPSVSPVLTQIQAIEEEYNPRTDKAFQTEIQEVIAQHMVTEHREGQVLSRTDTEQLGFSQSEVSLLSPSSREHKPSSAKPELIENDNSKQKKPDSNF